MRMDARVRSFSDIRYQDWLKYLFVRKATQFKGQEFDFPFNDCVMFSGVSRYDQTRAPGSSLDRAPADKQRTGGGEE